MASVKVNYGKAGSVISYRLRADLGRDTQGKQIVKTRTIKSSGALTPKKELREMQRQADEWERNMKEGLAPVQEKTFKQFVEIDFFQVHVHSGELKESTMEFYRNMAPRTIDYFGNMELTKIGSLDIEKFLNSLRTVTQENGKPLSASTVRHYYSFLKILFNFAEKHDLLIKNPMLKISPPKVEKKPVEFFSQQEAKEFLSILGTAPLQWQALMTTLILTGLRRGEAVGLQWQDISFTNGDLSVMRNVVYTPSSGIVVGTPKTSTALRTIPLPDSLLGLLKRWQKEQYGPYGGMLLPNAFVFSDAATPYEPLRPDRITRWLRRFEQSHGLRELSPHDLRHSCASLLLSGGATLKATQAILGHADASTTLDFYAGVTQENLRKETDKLKDVLGL